ncbi:MAG: zf-HC2 domain-containing protein [Polyangiaceae bacterium]|nr:zf-HC2 domain-containing protein [Polyangiaceae bacterium]
MSACRQLAPWVEVLVDGELPCDKVLEVEQHLATCEACRERARFDQALRLSVQRVARAAEPGAGFEERLAAALSAERVREERREREVARDSRLSWRQTAMVVAAAAGTFVWAAASGDASRSPVASPGPESSLASTLGTAPLEGLLDELVNYHVESPATAPEVLEPADVDRFEPEVGVPVRAPALTQYGARWEGGSLVPMAGAAAPFGGAQATSAAVSRARRAASLRYRLGNHRVTVYVYDASRLPLRVMLEPRVVRNLPVYVGARRGYSVAAVEQRGVGYAVATDLGDRESAELVVASVY